MKNSEFIALATSNALKTARIRVYTGTCYTGAYFIPKKMCLNIGRIIRLIQDKMEEEHFCAVNEYLLIYNFQLLTERRYCKTYCSLAMVRKTLDELEKTDEVKGEVFELIIRSDGEVINSAKTLIEISGFTEEEAYQETGQVPKTYGNYYEYNALACVLAVAGSVPAPDDLTAFFRQELDEGELIEDAKVYLSISEAYDYLNTQKNAVARYMIELSCAMEDIEEIKKQGANLSEYMVKIINFDEHIVIVSPTIERREQDETQRLEETWGIRHFSP